MSLDRRLEQLLDERGRARERGAALVMVLIFGIGAMTMVLLLLTLANEGIKAESETHERKALQAVLKVGVAQSLHEINSYRYRDLHAPPLTASEYDSDGSGHIGAMLGPQDANGTYLGLPVVDPETGRTIGHYRTTIREQQDPLSDDSVFVMTVTAAVPGFAPANVPHRIVAGTEVVIRAERFRWFGDDNPFYISGDPGTINVSFPNPNAANFSVIDPNAERAAGNITNPDLYAAIVAGLVDGNESRWIGADADGNPTTGAGTVTNEPTGTLNHATLSALYDGVDTRFNTLKNAPGTTALTSLSGNLGNGVFSISGNVNAGDVTGSGTLLIDGTVNLGGSTLNWDGDVIIWGDGASLNTQGGGTNAGVQVTGDVFVSADGSAGASIRFGNGSRGSTIEGGLYLLSKSDVAQMDFGSGGRVTVNGITAVLGQGVNVNLQNGTTAAINGSFVMGVVNEGPFTFNVAPGGALGRTMTFNQGFYDRALNSIETFIRSLDDQPLKPLVATGYREVVTGADLLDLQDDAAAADDDLGWPED